MPVLGSLAAVNVRIPCMLKTHARALICLFWSAQHTLLASLALLCGADLVSCCISEGLVFTGQKQTTQSPLSLQGTGEQAEWGKSDLVAAVLLPSVRLGPH